MLRVKLRKGETRKASVYAGAEAHGPLKRNMSRRQSCTLAKIPD